MVALPTTLVTRRRFTAAEYHQMAEAGILTEDDRVELIGGEIVEMSPIGGRHVESVTRLTQLLSRQVGQAALVSVQNPVRLAADDEPQPDLTVIRDRPYHGAVPAADDVLLLIEVADSSLLYDRQVKLPRYAAAGIAEAWLVDLGAGTIGRYTEPSATGYRQLTRAGRGETLTSTVLSMVSIPVATVIP